MTLGISPHSTRQNVSKLVAFRRGWVSLSQHFRESGRPLGIFFGWRKTKHIMVALCNRADHYIFILFLSSFFFFPRLISVVGDWMFTILWHMVWP